jgi:hypothetical protein
MYVMLKWNTFIVQNSYMNYIQRKPLNDEVVWIWKWRSFTWLRIDRETDKEEVRYFVQNVNFLNYMIAYWEKNWVLIWEVAVSNCHFWSWMHTSGSSNPEYYFEKWVIVTFELECLSMDPQISFCQGKNIYSSFLNTLPSSAPRFP